MRLRKKPWIAESLAEFKDIVLKNPGPESKGRWHEVFGRARPLHVELGTGKGRFITELAENNPEINYVGIEAEQDVIYYAAKKVHERGLKNVILLVFDVGNILDIFAPAEISRLYINFCDPWPKKRHAKRRLTHANFLAKYRVVLQAGGQIYFKTDNEKLFEFSLNEMSAQDMRLSNITFDLHNSGYEGNIMTEYEQKFSSTGMKIFRCEATFRQTETVLH